MKRNPQIDDRHQQCGPQRRHSEESFFGDWLSL